MNVWEVELQHLTGTRRIHRSTSNEQQTKNPPLPGTTTLRCEKTVVDWIMHRSIITKNAQRLFTKPRSTTYNTICGSVSRRAASNTTESNNTGTQSAPFYGLPQPPGRKRASSIASLLQVGGTVNRLLQLASTQSQTVTELIQQSMIAIRDPTRADAVAAVSEMTGRRQLFHLLKTMQQHPVGQQILRDRPTVSKTTIPYHHLIEQAHRVRTEYGTVANIPDDQLTFGISYGLFLLQHGFDPDERDDVKYLSSPTEQDIAYVMLRFRQCHDYWHVLTQLPPTVTGEIGLKLLELFHMNMPVAALSCLSQSAVILLSDSTGTSSHTMDPNNPTNSTNIPSATKTDDLNLIWNLYLPWARQQARNMEAANVSLLNVYYENEFSVPLHILRRRLQLQPYK